MPMWVFDPAAWAIIDVNDAAVSHYGYTRDEFLGMTVRDLHPPDQRPRFDAAIAEAERSGALRDYTENSVWKHLKRDGSVIDVEVIAHNIIYDERPAGLVMIRDVTAQTTLEAALRLDSAILRQVPVAIVITSPDGVIRDWLGAADAMFGYTADEMRGQLPESLLQTQADLDTYVRLIMRLVSEGDAAAELALRRKDGSNVTVAATAAYLQGQAEPAQPIIWVMRDIQDRLLLEEHQLTTDLLKSELIEAVEMADFREKLTAMVANEFKSPLNAIKLYRDIVARYSQTADEPRTRDALARIDTQITHLIDLINDLLALNQYSMGKLEPEYITFDLTDLCGAVTDHWQSIMREKYTIIYQRPGKPIIIAGDLKLLKRVLDNLLSNAVKYSAKGGSIILSVAQAGNEAVIRVKDEGIGIPNAARSRVFEMFERAENALHLSGTGVGLAFCRMVVDLHDGRIGFESEVDRGTTFVVQLPLKQPKL